jgi:hypothetical protein
MGEQLKAVATNSYEDLKMEVDALAADAEKFYSKGNAAAGTRLRMGLQKVKGLVQACRAEVSSVKALRQAHGDEQASAPLSQKG